MHRQTGLAMVCFSTINISINMLLVYVGITCQWKKKIYLKCKKRRNRREAQKKRIRDLQKREELRIADLFHQATLQRRAILGVQRLKEEQAKKEAA